MNREFIPYEQALALKELGFDEPCFGWYASDKSLIKDYVIKMHLKAPTFSQAFRFFREKYGYYISVFRTHDGNWGTDLWLLGVHKPKATVFGETYEEAELACLKKLIEIVKQ
jgi:hypothetical protein